MTPASASLLSLTAGTSAHIQCCFPAAAWQMVPTLPADDASIASVREEPSIVASIAGLVCWEHVSSDESDSFAMEGGGGGAQTEKKTTVTTEYGSTHHTKNY